MNIKELIKEFENCECGNNHKCDIENIVIGKNALFSLPELTEPYKNIVFVCDKNTYSAAGKKVEELMNKKGRTLIFQREGLLIPNEEAISELESFLGDCDLIVGIGSGVINDICKYVSFEKKLPYFIVATAPSMDGYASTGAAMITGGMKVTYPAHTPKAIIADNDILKTAPLEMIQAGYGDIIGKYSALNDWKLSRIINNENYCQRVYDLTMKSLKKTEPLYEKLLNREGEAVGALAEALVMIGVAMSFAGNSRPASGSEHHLSHFFEITGILDNAPYLAHGTDVIFSTYATQLVREKILNTDFSTEFKRENDEKRAVNLKKIYKSSYEGVKELQEKTGLYKNDRTAVYREKGKEIKAVLSEVPKSGEIKKIIENIGLDLKDFENIYGEEKIKNAVLYAKDLKDRYTVLCMYYDMFSKQEAN